MPYDPTLYAGAAPHYVRGRPPYSRELSPVLAAELGLDGSGRLLDVGCGPGVLTLELAPLFAEAIGLDPDPEMLAAAARRADGAQSGTSNVRWVRGLAEELPRLALGEFRVVSFGRSFHWTERERVAEAAYDVLEPGGTLVLVGQSRGDPPPPDGPDLPLVPRDAIMAVVERYLGPERRAGQGVRVRPPDSNADALARTRFGRPRRVTAPGRADLVQDADAVLSNVLSTAYAAPHLFGDRLAAFEADVRAELARRSPGGLFWHWPGNTEILIAAKP